MAVAYQQMALFAVFEGLVFILLLTARVQRRLHPFQRALAPHINEPASQQQNEHDALEHRKQSHLLISNSPRKQKDALHIKH